MSIIYDNNTRNNNNYNDNDKYIYAQIVSYLSVSHTVKKKHQESL